MTQVRATKVVKSTEPKKVNVELSKIELRATELSKQIDATNQKFFGVFDEALKKENIKKDADLKSIYSFRKMAASMRFIDENKYQEKLSKSYQDESNVNIKFYEAKKEIDILRSQKIANSFFDPEMVQKRQLEAEFLSLNQKYKIELQRNQDDIRNQKGLENQEQIKYLRSLQNKNGGYIR